MDRHAGNKAAGDPLAPATSKEDWEAQGWATEPTSVVTAPRLEATVSIRFDPESALLLRRAARLTGRTKSEFIRRATLREARQVLARAAQNPLVVQSVARMEPPMTGSSAQGPVGVAPTATGAVPAASYVSGITVQVDGAMVTSVP